MTESRRAAIIAELVQKLRDNGSWAGETHVQKTTYFLQELLDVPLGLPYTLYKFGPFSFELRDLLSQMRGLDQLDLEPQPRPYGPKLVVGESAEQLRTRFPKTLRRYDEPLDFVASEIGHLGVGPLERLATALLVTREKPTAGLDERVVALTDYKPHVGPELARAALIRVGELEAMASSR